MTRMVDVIAHKRDGGELSDAEIDFFIQGFTHGDIPDYQASALLMAIYLRGMSRRETVDLTLSMETPATSLISTMWLPLSWTNIPPAAWETKRRWWWGPLWRRAACRWAR